MKAPSWWRRYDRTPVKELGRSNPTRFGVIVIVILVIAAYFGFTKHIPFKHGFRLKAVFSTAVNVRKSSPVRIAGVDVGKVSHIAREGSAGLVTMEIESSGLPIHSDATVKIRPRTFLEGNWFVELQPGSPSAKVLSSGATLPITQTSDPVQLDQVLDALNTETRANLQNFLIGYGDGLTRKPNAADNAEQDPELYGLTGAQALNKAYQLGPSSLRGTAVLNQAITGTVPNDLSALVASIGKVTSALNVHEQQLGELIVNFNAFFRSFADQSASLRATVAELPSSLSAINRGFTALGAALPPAKTFALDILPGVKATPATVKATLPWIEQVQASLAPNELGGVAEGLAEAAPWIAQLQSEQVPFQQQSEVLSKCQTNVVFPAGNTKLQDGASTSGVEDYKEFWESLVGLNSIGQNFDGNGTMAHFLLSSSGQTLVSAPVSILGTKAQGLHLLAHASLQPLGTRPAYPASEPPYKPTVPCYTQTLPNFDGPLSQGPADGSGG
jgi:phospholipid/cholesterol/gamma-HCH transport system substrate-binding protein